MGRVLLSHFIRKRQIERQKASQSHRPKFLQNRFPRRCNAKSGMKAGHSGLRDGMDTSPPQEAKRTLGEANAQSAQGFPVESADPLSSKILNGGGTICLVSRPSRIGLLWHADAPTSSFGLGQG